MKRCEKIMLKKELVKILNVLTESRENQLDEIHSNVEQYMYNAQDTNSPNAERLENEEYLLSNFLDDIDLLVAGIENLANELETELYD